MTTYRRGIMGHLLTVLSMVLGTVVATMICHFIFPQYAIYVGALVFILFLWMLISDMRSYLTLEGNRLVFHEGKVEKEFFLKEDTNWSYKLVTRSQGGHSDCILFIEGERLDCSFLGSYKFQALCNDIENIVGERVYTVDVKSKEG